MEYLRLLFPPLDSNASKVFSESFYDESFLITTSLKLSSIWSVFASHSSHFLAFLAKLFEVRFLAKCFPSFSKYT